MIKITSTAFAEGAIIPSKYTCLGENINPPLLIKNIPRNTKSLALIVDDPDSPKGIFTHWILWNVDPKTTEIKENSVPKVAFSGTNDFGNTKYGGPCPGSGTHRYFFTVLALDIILELANGSNRKAFDKAIQQHIINQGQLMAKFAK